MVVSSLGCIRSDGIVYYSITLESMSHVLRRLNNIQTKRVHGSGKHNIRHTFPFVASSRSLTSVGKRLQMSNKPSNVEGLQ